MTRILMVQRFDMVNVGCAERIWRQAEELSNRGYEITLVQFPHAERRRTVRSLREEAPPGVRILSLDRSGSAVARNIKILAQEIASNDLVHLWKCYPDTGIPVLWGNRHRPHALHYDWDDLEGGPGGIAQRLTGSRQAGRLVAAWEREILHWVDSVTVASDEIRNLCRDWGFPEAGIFSGPVGAVLKEVAPEARRKWEDLLDGLQVLSFVGQMEADDFPIDVLEGVAEALREHPRIRLVMVGDGTGRSKLERETERLRIADRCQFTGYLPHSEAQAILALSAGFLFPLKDDLMSRCKSPLVVIEALSHGTPVIGSNVGEVPKMVGDCGVLVTGLTNHAWKAGVCALIDRIDRDLELGNRTRERFIENWTWAKSVDNLEKAYHHAISVVNR